MPWKESPTVRAITSDGSALFYNAEYVRGAPPLVLEAHLMHVLLHWALGHPWRGEGRDPRRWQAATDLALVGLFLRSGYDYRDVLPLRYPVETGRGRSAEEIASILPEPEPTEPGATPAVADIPECWQDPADDRAADQRRRQRWRERLVQAAQSMAYTGRGGAFSEEVLGTLGSPTVDWRGRLTMFLQRTSAADYSWVPPNRRYLHRGVYLPGTRTRHLGDLVVALDTSGSIDPEMARGFLAEVSELAQLVGSSGGLLFLQVDDEVRSATVLGPGTRLPPVIQGRGGTNFRAAFEYLQGQTSFTPSGLVYLTDGQGTFPEHPPPYPVLWALVAPTVVPFGATLLIPQG
jgi:predicted metal-dependent peptidase